MPVVLDSILIEHLNTYKPNDLKVLQIIGLFVADAKFRSEFLAMEPDQQLKTIKTFIGPMDYGSDHKVNSDRKEDLCLTRLATCLRDASHIYGNSGVLFLEGVENKVAYSLDPRLCCAGRVC